MTVTLVVMGVSGVGKSSVAAELVSRTGWAFVEGDDLHPESNRAKMASGIPLDDDDRWPWLRRVAAWIGEQEAAGRNAVVTCSALKRSYRDLLRDGHPSERFVHLLAPPELISARITARRNHYMPPSLLESQLATLEPLQPDEQGIEVETTGDPAAVAERVLEQLGDEIVLPADRPSGDEPDHPAPSS
ncbi:gluconokinase [Pseudonocardia sp. CA-142604]|uniref:gluconokinase n=1 Tax=Pseudonocardia sp. CA-142604 TaxID=3240024 RepID=UPI003D94C078